MFIAKMVQALREYRRQTSGRTALVPTMGALHAGHRALIDRARQVAEHVIVSVFVNPTQFGPTEDLSRYPRPVSDDLAICREAGVGCVFLPEVETMYPPGVVDCEVDVPRVTGMLEGAVRPGHFAGVGRVCLKLFHMAAPDVVVFGRKDYQQLTLIRALVADLAMPIAVEAVPTIRDVGGLAMSSRNRYLDDAQRKQALGLSKALRQARAMIEDGETDPAIVEQAMATTMQVHQLGVDYAVLRHPDTLMAMDAIDPPLTGGVVALVAARLGNIRLIDNLPIGIDGVEEAF